ncbi:unnamed protein product [Rotaria sp. Silwood2]|nr:unnamed protein product [Rotaria sp. Silwood2]CAF2755800.1 unnamed protein product [Rotaria sp. Silwood2]CAF3004816.1 unnamed protein product [Rotaria sp. Silwood2]CAF3152713.1 unnamed protein product [Rotaria sp. Silwood2]CAF4078743.1 unnamed protein product [Rotaria sp. Silwood2]
MLKLIFVLLGLMRTACCDDLPGLEYLSIGFDALKMINTIEDPACSTSERLKYEIFNFMKPRNGQTGGSTTEVNFDLGLFDDLAGLYGTFSWSSNNTRFTKDFKKYSVFEWKFLSSVNITADIDENIMKVWLDRASRKPTVTNRTLSSIVNLLSDCPSTIRRHLQSTIDFYLTHAHLSTLEQLKQKTKTIQSKRAPLATSKSIPGLDVCWLWF